MLKTILQHLSGQSVITLINVVVGIFFVRWLPIEEYGLYVIATLLQAVACAFSDFGITNGVNTLMARDIRSQESHARIMRAAWHLRRRFIPIAALCGLALGWVLFNSSPATALTLGVLAVSAILCGCLQSHVNVKKSVLNAHSDGPGLFRAGLAECIPRLILSPLCLIFPDAEVAMAINLVGLFVSSRIISHSVSRYVPAPNGFGAANGDLSAFVIPLIPSVIYSVAQGHLGVLVLGISGSTAMVAETGALSRLGQILSLLLVLNPFWVQPHFAQIGSSETFRRDLFFIAAGLVSMGLLLTTSACLLPGAWLWILGDNYRSNDAQLPIAIIGAVAYLINAVLYTIVLSRGVTRGQSWGIVLGIGSQAAFLTFHGVNSTESALLLNMLPAVCSMVVQVGLIYHLLSANAFRSTRGGLSG